LGHLEIYTRGDRVDSLPPPNPFHPGISVWFIWGYEGLVCLDQGLKISLQNILNVMKKNSKYITGNLNAAQKNPKNHEKNKNP